MFIVDLLFKEKYLNINTYKKSRIFTFSDTQTMVVDGEPHPAEDPFTPGELDEIGKAKAGADKAERDLIAIEATGGTAAEIEHFRQIFIRERSELVTTAFVEGLHIPPAQMEAFDQTLKLSDQNALDRVTQKTLLDRLSNILQPIFTLFKQAGDAIGVVEFPIRDSTGNVDESDSRNRDWIGKRPEWFNLWNFFRLLVGGAVGFVGYEAYAFVKNLIVCGFATEASGCYFTAAGSSTQSKIQGPGACSFANTCKSCEVCAVQTASIEGCCSETAIGKPGTYTPKCICGLDSLAYIVSHAAEAFMPGAGTASLVKKILMYVAIAIVIIILGVGAYFIYRKVQRDNEAKKAAGKDGGGGGGNQQSPIVIVSPGSNSYSQPYRSARM